MSAIRALGPEHRNFQFHQNRAVDDQIRAEYPDHYPAECYGNWCFSLNGETCLRESEPHCFAINRFNETLAQLVIDIVEDADDLLRQIVVFLEFGCRRYSSCSQLVLNRCESVFRQLFAQVELGEFEVAGLGDLEVARGAGDDSDLDAGAFEQAGLVGAGELVGGGLGEARLEQAAACALGGWPGRPLAGTVAVSDGAVRGALDLLDGVDGRKADDGRAVLRDGVDGAVDGLGVDERAGGVVDEDDVVVGTTGLGDEVGEGVGDGLLTDVAAFDHMDFAGEAELGDLGADALNLRRAHGDVDGGDARHGEEGAQAVDEYGHAGEREELLGRGRAGRPM